MPNFRHALRTLIKSPVLSLIAVLSLALGIGANAAIFSILEQALLRPLDVPAADQLVNLSAPGPKPGSTSCNTAGSCEDIFTYAMFRDLQNARTGLSSIAAHRVISANLAYQGQTSGADAALVSGSYFPALRLEPVIGRLIAPSDDQTFGGDPVAVLSYGYWQNQLGGDPGILGESLVVNGFPLTIIGVAPEDFEGTTLGVRPRVFIPLTMREQVAPLVGGFEDRQRYWLYLFGRLEPGTTMEQAANAINAAYRPILAEVEAPELEGMSDQMLERFRAREVVLSEGRRGQSEVHDDGRTPLLLLFGIAGLVLMIACANVANLLLARGANRSMEMAIRLSLGAGRGRVVGQLLAEAIILAVAGGAASFLVARGTLYAIAYFLPAEVVAIFDYGINWRVAGFVAVVALLTGIVFGLFPAFHSTRSDLVSTIRANSGQIAGARTAARFRSTLVVGQIALAMMLLVSAGLFLRSLVNISRVELGIEPESFIMFDISPELNGYEPAQSRQLFQRVEEELAALPGVDAVTTSLVPFLGGSSWGTGVDVEGFAEEPETDDNSRLNRVGPGYFRALGIPLLAGREFTAADGPGAPLVAVVNETFARKFGIEGTTVGSFMGEADDSLNIQIVGLVRDTKYSDVRDETPPLFFTPYLQDENAGSLTFYARTSLPAEEALAMVQPLIGRLDPNLPVENLKTMPQQLRENIFLDRMISTLAAAFAGVATLLAAIGLYGVLAYTVSQRTREIGVRMAIGAAASDVRAMVMKQVGMFLIIGTAVGAIAAIALGRGAASLLYNLSGNDPLTIVIALLLLSAIGLLAGYLPAYRASRVDPVTALRFS